MKTDGQCAVCGGSLTYDHECKPLVNEKFHKATINPDIERNRYLTEAMGICVTFKPDHNGECLNCDEWYSSHITNVIDFSTPDGFFKLWNWSKEQEWWKYFWSCRIRIPYIGFLHEDDINPDKLANAIYKFLMDYQNESK